METADHKDSALPVGWVQVQQGDAKLYISAVDKVAVATNPSGLPPGWIARAHRTLGLVFAHAQSLIDGSGRWTVIDPRGLTPTGVMMCAKPEGPVFVDEETGTSSMFDPRWNSQTTASERRSLVRFEVTMNTGPSARHEIAAQYSQLDGMLGCDNILPEAALVFVSAGSCLKSYDKITAAEIGELSFDEETTCLLERLHATPDGIAEPCLREILAPRGLAESDFSSCEGYAAHLRVKTQGCIARLDCKAAGLLELPLQCIVFGYFRINGPEEGIHFRLLAPVRGYVDAKDLFRFERVARPADISSSPVAAVLSSVGGDHVRASVIRAFANYQRAGGASVKMPSPPKEATTDARSIARPSVHTFLDAMSEAWRQLLSGGFVAPSADTTPVSATVIQPEDCETKQQRRRGLELWDLLRRKYKIAALRIMRARIEVERHKMHKAVESYEKRRVHVIDDRLCKICWDAEIAITCVPCGHQCVCYECAFDVRQCPMCCTAIVDRRVTVFLPSYGQNTTLLHYQQPLRPKHASAVRAAVSEATHIVRELQQGMTSEHLRLFSNPPNSLEQRLAQAQEALLTSDITFLLSSLPSDA